MSSRKVYAKPPAIVRSQLVMMIVVASLFLAIGPVFVIVSEGEARLIAALFSVLWSVVCISLIMHFVKALKLVREGKIEIAEVGDMENEVGNDFAKRLRDLEKLKSDGLISADEYQEKRAVILQEQW